MDPVARKIGHLYTGVTDKYESSSCIYFPTIAIVDPELMLSVPQKLTAYQGMDAFFHSTEGYLANVAQPASDIFALDAIRRINEYLPQAVQNGNDIKSREQLAWASTEAGMVESTSCCISEHSMEHALSAFYPNLPHGAGLVALSVPYYSYLLQKDRDSVAKRYCDIAKAMGKKGNNPEEFIDALKELINSIGLKDLKLSDWGVKKEEAEMMRPVLSVQQYINFLFYYADLYLRILKIVVI